MDTEGLISGTKRDGFEYDNELAAFVIGLSDLTLVIKKGEGKEVNDVLESAIPDFMRMKILEKHQGYHFVHLNTEVEDDKEQAAVQIGATVGDLAKKSAAAAKDSGQKHNFKKIAEVLQDEPRKNDTSYIGGFRDGASTSHYSKTVQQLKSNVIARGVQQQKKFGTFRDFEFRLEEVWDFVLSFRNVLAHEAHRKLSKIFDEQQWNIKQEIREMLKKKLNILENMTKEETKEQSRSDGISQRTDENLKRDHLKILKDHLKENISKMGEEMKHCFRCLGYGESNSNLQNGHPLTRNEQEFLDDIISLQKTLERELTGEIADLKARLTNETKQDELNADIDEMLKKKVQAFATRKSTHNHPKHMKEMFENFWEDACRDVSMTLKHKLENESADVVDEGVRAAAKRCFDLGDQPSRKRRKSGKGKRKRRSSERLSERSSNNKEEFIVNIEKHIEDRNMEGENKSRDYKLEKERFHYHVQVKSQNIIQEVEKYYDANSSPNGKKFSPKYSEMLFNEVKEHLDSVSGDGKFEVTDAYKGALVSYIAANAVAGFNAMNEKYFWDNSIGGLLDRKKSSYYDLFFINIVQDDTVAASKFCNNFLMDLIEKNIEENLSCTELLHDLRVHCGEMFRDVKSIQASIMMDLFQENRAKMYLKYIKKYEDRVKHELEKKSLEHFCNHEGLKNLALTKLTKIVEELHTATDRSAEDLPDQKPIDESLESSADQKAVNKSEEDSSKGFFNKFLKQIEHLKISHWKAAAYRAITVTDKNKFGDEVHQQLEEVKQKLEKEIRTWQNVSKKLEDRSLTEFLFKEIVSCTARCTFCGVTCDSHFGARTHGNHSATFHRPVGLLLETPTDCCALVASSETFPHNSELAVPYKDYHKIYPHWTIDPNADPDAAEKYWKWVFSQHRKKISKCYHLNPADIPSEWNKYTTDEVMEELEVNYDVKVEPTAETSRAADAPQEEVKASPKKK